MTASALYAMSKFAGLILERIPEVITICNDWPEIPAIPGGYYISVMVLGIFFALVVALRC